MVKRFNVVAPRKYTVKGGAENTVWLPIGQIIEFENGGQILQLNMFPNTEFKIFPVDKPEQAHPKDEPQKSAIDEIPTINIDEEIKPEDLPF